MVKFLDSIDEFLLIRECVYLYRKGHKHTNWSIAMFNDHINGVLQLMYLAKRKKYKFLEKKMQRNFNISKKIRVPDAFTIKDIFTIIIVLLKFNLIFFILKII